MEKAYVASKRPEGTENIKDDCRGEEKRRAVEKVLVVSREYREHKVRVLLEV